MSTSRRSSRGFEERVVEMIENGRTEEALSALSQHYGVSEPKLRVGRVKGMVNAHGVYVSSKKTIFLSGREEFNNAYVVLHEFYHHLRNTLGTHRGTEKSAGKFAIDFLRKAKVPKF